MGVEQTENPDRELNPDNQFRRLAHYPLCYQGSGKQRFGRFSL